MTPVFSSKLDRLHETVLLAAEVNPAALATAMQAHSVVPIRAIGSGGSVIAAEYLAACRSSLSHQFTSVQTPMAHVLEADGPVAAPCWLFSATGENNDIVAAFDASAAQKAPIEIVTSGEHGRLVLAARSAPFQTSQIGVHLAPVADPKDGFLATHSVTSAVVRLMLACDHLIGAVPVAERVARLLAVVDRVLAPEIRSALQQEVLAPLSSCDTVLILHDPSLVAAAVSIETSFWEAGICAVQRADFRNFAHGRHSWLGRHPSTFVLALVSERSRDIWGSIEDAIPAKFRRAQFVFGRAGREDLFEAIMTSLAIVEGAGALRGIDPGKPGVAEFGRQIYDSAKLRDLAAEPPAIKRKRRAERKVDPATDEIVNWNSRYTTLREDLQKCEIRAVVLDYDGTVVATPDRFSLPDKAIIDLIAGLVDAGILVAFASGRGGSLGESLRKALDVRHHSKVIVGYYNGACIAPLALDIEAEALATDRAVAAFYDLIVSEKDLFIPNFHPKKGSVQITIAIEKLVSPDAGVRRLQNIAKSSETSSLPLQFRRSGHSIDIFPGWAGKGRVVREVRKLLADESADVMSVGDSGDCLGNDYELLSESLGLSVGQVCHRGSVCWNILPFGVDGPAGLERILRALKVIRSGAARIDVPFLFRP